MAESAFLDDGSHLDHKITSADHPRRNETCRPFHAMPSQHRTLSDQICSGGPCSVNRSARTSMTRSEEHTSELQSLMRISYAVFCLKKKINTIQHNPSTVAHISS